MKGNASISCAGSRCPNVHLYPHCSNTIIRFIVFVRIKYCSTTAWVLSVLKCPHGGCGFRSPNRSICEIMLIYKNWPHCAIFYLLSDHDRRPVAKQQQSSRPQPTSCDVRPIVVTSSTAPTSQSPRSVSAFVSWP